MSHGKNMYVHIFIQVKLFIAENSDTETDTL